MLQRGDGRAKATQTADEMLQIIAKDIKDLDPAERSTALQIIASKMEEQYGIPVPQRLMDMLLADVPKTPLPRVEGLPLEDIESDSIEAFLPGAAQKMGFDTLGDAGAIEPPKLPPWRGATKLYDLLGTSHFKTPPVDMETFVLDPYFLGETCGDVWPKLLEDITEVFRGSYSEIIFTGALNAGKCVGADTPVTCSRTGIRRTVKEWAEAGTPFGVHSLAYDTTRTWETGEATAFASGRKQCVKVTLHSGRSLTLSTDHPVLTSVGWVHAGALKGGDLAATARLRPAPDVPLAVTDAEVIWLAYFTADGCGASGSWCSGSVERADEYEACAAQVFPHKPPRRWYEKGAHYVQAKRSRALRDRWGVDGLSKDKRIHADVWRLTDSQLALFLNRLLASDGHVAERQIELTVASQGLAEDVQDLLLRFGVHASVRARKATYVYNGERRHRDAWRLAVSGRDCARLLAVVGPLKGKEEASGALATYLAESAVGAKPNIDKTPFGYEAFKRLSKEKGRSIKMDPTWAALRVSGATQRASHARLDRIAARAGGLPEWAAWWQDPAIFWDEVVSVEFQGVQDVYDITVPGIGSFVSQGFVLHNTYISSIGMVRGIYELSCMKNPQKSFNLSSDTPIVFAGFSAKEELAKEVVLKNIIGKIANSPYFMQNFRPRFTQKNFRFPSNIMGVAKATTDTGVLGMAVYMALMDESDFMPKKKKVGVGDKAGVTSMAKAIYDGLRRRMMGRFGKFAKIFLPCSKTTTESFLQTRVRAAETDPSVFVRDYATWEVKPGKYSDTKFWVLCGNETVNSRIITTAEEAAQVREHLPERAALIEVPDDYLSVFQADLDGSVRDIGGVATVAISPFFQQRQKIQATIDSRRQHPFSVQVLDPSLGGYFEPHLMVREYENQDPYEGRTTVRRPIVNPLAPRHIHIDASTKHCASGFCMAHRAGTVEMIRAGGYVEHAPFYIVDFLLQIVPPPAGEIEIGMFRRMIYDLTEMGYPITHVSLDQHQSTDTLQQLANVGYQTRLISSNWQAYQGLKNVLYEGRLSMYAYDPLLREMRSVEADWETRQIKKPAEFEGKQGSKDMTDALAGVIRSLQEQPHQEALPPMKGIVGATGMEGAGWTPAPQGAMQDIGGMLPLLVGGLDGEDNEMVVQARTRAVVDASGGTPGGGPRPFRLPGTQGHFVAPTALQGVSVYAGPAGPGGMRPPGRIGGVPPRNVVGNTGAAGGLQFLPLVMGEPGKGGRR